MLFNQGHLPLLQPKASRPSLMLHLWIKQLAGNLQLKQPARCTSSHIHIRVHQMRRHPWLAWPGACFWPFSNLAFWAALSTCYHVTSTFSSRSMCTVCKSHIHALLGLASQIHLHTLCFKCIALFRCRSLNRSRPAWCPACSYNANADATSA